jgi:hypothetical protein
MNERQNLPEGKFTFILPVRQKDKEEEGGEVEEGDESGDRQKIR